MTNETKKVYQGFIIVVIILSIGLIHGFYSKKKEKEKYLSFPRIQNLTEVNAVVLSKKYYISFYRGNYLVKLSNDTTYLVGYPLRDIINEGSQIIKKKNNNKFIIIKNDKVEYYTPR